MSKAAKPWAPEKCPITQRPFFMWIEHHKTGEMVPTYGGPYDSYTLAEFDGEDFVCERFDHDAGGWLIDCMEGLGVKLVDDQSLVIDPNNTRYDEIEAFAAAPVAAQPDLTQQTLDDVKAGIPARDAEIEALRKEIEALQATQAQQPGPPAGFISIDAYDRLHALCESQAERLLAIDDMQQPVSGGSLADRLDAFADTAPPGSQMQSDLYAAATIWRKHLKGSAAQQPVSGADVQLLKDARHRIANLSRASVPLNDPLDGPVLRRLDDAIDAAAVSGADDAMERALTELVDKIVPDLDTGDLLADAATASKALDSAQQDAISSLHEIRDLMLRHHKMEKFDFITELAGIVTASPIMGKSKPEPSNGANVLDEREDFEKAWAASPGHRGRPERFEDGPYKYPAANTAWDFWEARAARAQKSDMLQSEVLSMVQMLEANEWADHCGKSELGQRLEWAITALQNRIAELTKSSSQQDADKVDAERYRFASNALLVLGGGRKFGWPIAPLTKAQWDKYIDAARKEPDQ